MEPQYQYTLTFPLTGDCPDAVAQFFAQLAEGQTPDELPEVDERALETSAAHVVALLAGSTQLGDGRVSVVGTASAEQFFMPFIALAEWLARWSAARGPVGFYHLSSMPHPTLLYFADGRPYMLQPTGTPVGLADGEELGELEPATVDDELPEEG